jgi:hypothetical protein
LAKRQGRVYPPHQLRSILSDLTLNTASANSAVNRIGVMPNLRNIIERELRPPTEVAAAELRASLKERVQ